MTKQIKERKITHLAELFKKFMFDFVFGIIFSAPKTDNMQDAIVTGNQNIVCNFPLLV